MVAYKGNPHNSPFLYDPHISSAENRLKKEVRIAVPTKGKKGLEDTISEVFGRSKTYTIVDVEEEVIKNVKILENQAESYSFGAGPIVVKMLVDSDVNIVVSPEFGPGVSKLLEEHGLKKISMERGTIVNEADREALDQQKLN